MKSFVPAWIGLLAGLLAPFALAAPAGPASSNDEQLVRIERKGREDAEVLRSRGLPVVMELSSCLLMRGGPDAARQAARLGYRTRVLDEAAAGTPYLVIGLRPDSDLEAVAAAGTRLLEEENWILIRLDPGGGGRQLDAARVFVTPVPLAPLTWPRPTPRRDAAAMEDAAGPDPVVQKIVASVDEAEIDRFFSDLTGNPPTGSRYSLGQGCRDAGQYCFDTYRALGIPARYDDWNPSHAPNVIGELSGAVTPDSIYIVVGHLDDLPSSGPAPGADDNASGSVNVLESARVLSCWGVKNTVRFLNATGEEQGLKGSHAYAQAALDQGEKILGVINMDMIAWEGDGLPQPEDLDINFNGPSEWLGRLFADSATLYDTGLVVDAFYCPSLTASDHYAFWQRGYDAICGITDNENYCGHGGNYPHYHTSDDTIANCGDLSFFYSVVRTSVATLAELAEPFKITFADSAFACQGEARILVADRDLNADPGLQETVTIPVWSSTEPDPEQVVLTERSADSMIFEGTIPLSSAPPVTGDGRLSVGEGDILEARYVDALDCDGSPDVEYMASAVVDCSAPLISNVHETDLTDVSAVIAWTTDETADSVVVWGETTPPSQTTSAEAPVTDHRVPLEGLRECTVYYYEVQSTDPAGNLAVANDGGRYYHFETLGDFGDGLQACHTGQVSIDEAVYSCAGTVSFSVVDLDLNGDPETVDTARLEVTSTTETLTEWVTVTETDVNSSRFTGSIPTAAGAPQADGRLQVAEGDTITVTYHDADDGTGLASLAYDTAGVDCRGPVIRNLRIENLTNARAHVRFETDEPGDSLVEWGPTPALGRSTSDSGRVTSHDLLLNDFDSCDAIYFRVRSSDQFGTTGSATGPDGPFAFQASTIPGLYWRDNFESGSAGWSLEGEWEIGPPTGAGGSAGPPDPVGAYNNSALLGHDLAGSGLYPGDYEASIDESAESPPQNATPWRNTKVLLYRKLSAGPGDEASIWLWAGPGRLLYNSAGDPVQDDDFQLVTFDVGPLADGRPSVWLEFRQSSDGAGQYAGWNVDDLIFKDGSLPDYGPCGGCSRAPAFGGVTGADDDDACAAGGVTVSWDTAVAWGSGGGGTFAVYRDTDPVFTPSAANLVASGLAGLSYNDTTAPADQPVYYMVRAENDESCGSGPANSGLVDGNQVRAQATDRSSSPVPPAVTGLEVRLVGAGAHLRLRWQAAADATRYKVLRSLTPEPADFAEWAGTTRLYHDDLGAGANRETYYYLIRAVGACGQDGPL
ncbi:MAG: M28 family metallopeptidase [Acidobacteriota bacterium]|nr:M28 family metallopeptidase [Acidobacteriota bacterium]